MVANSNKKQAFVIDHISIYSSNSSLQLLLYLEDTT